MPVHESAVVDDRGSEPLLRTIPSTPATKTVVYTVTQLDTDRVPRFTLFTLAYRVFGDENLWWLIMDANPEPKEEYFPGDSILIPVDWQAKARAGDRVASGRTRNAG